MVLQSFFSLFSLKWLNLNMQLKFFVLQPEQEMDGVQVNIYDMQSPKCANHQLLVRIYQNPLVPAANFSVASNCVLGTWILSITMSFKWRS